MLARVSKAYWCPQGLDSSFKVSAAAHRSLQQQNTHMDKRPAKKPTKNQTPKNPPRQTINRKPTNPQNLLLLLGLTLFNSNLTNSSHSTSCRANSDVSPTRDF